MEGDKAARGAAECPYHPPYMKAESIIMPEIYSRTYNICVIRHSNRLRQCFGINYATSY